MTRQIHDQFAKHWLAELLKPVGGQVATQQEISSGETYYADVTVVPPPTVPVATLQQLGLLGKMVTRPSLIEHFWNPPTAEEIRNCLLKLLSLHRELHRQADRQDSPEPPPTEETLPHLWILTTSASDALLAFCDAKLKPPEWEAGVYFLAGIFKTTMVAINRLPLKPETLWLRMLGRGATQRQAVNEFLVLSRSNPSLYQYLLELLSEWGVYLTHQGNLVEDEKELLMNIKAVYQKWREETLQQGLQQGIFQERRQFVESLLKSRFGGIDDQLSRVITPLLQLPLDELARLLVQLSRDELVARFS